jgi:hypothetical protein
MDELPPIPTETAPISLIRGQIQFCLRHAGTLAAPWVERAVAALAAPGHTLVSDEVHRLVVGGPQGTVRWERSWKLVSWLGVHRRVDLVVFEGRPELIHARVDSEVVAACGLGDADGWRQLGPALERALGAPATRPVAA